MHREHEHPQAEQPDADTDAQPQVARIWHRRLKLRRVVVDVGIALLAAAAAPARLPRPPPRGGRRPAALAPALLLHARRLGACATRRAARSFLRWLIEPAMPQPVQTNTTVAHAPDHPAHKPRQRAAVRRDEALEEHARHEPAEAHDLGGERERDVQPRAVEPVALVVGLGHGARRARPSRSCSPASSRAGMRARGRSPAVARVGVVGTTTLRRELALLAS